MPRYLPFLFLATLTLVLPPPARAAEPPCLLVYGIGRNHVAELPQQDQVWDELNARFSAAVQQPLRDGGRRIAALQLPVAATDLARNLERLQQEAQRLGCNQVLESTLFADYETQTLIARLRLYPLLPVRGPLAQPTAQPGIGAPLYTDQREFDLNTRTLGRLRPSQLGREMGELAVDALVRAAVLPP